MSYNSSKGPQNIGDLINEDDPDTLIDWESDKIVFKTNGTKRFTIDNSEISGSGAAVIMGATVLGSSLKVSGSTTFAGSTSILSPISSSGLATFVGGVVTEGNLKVSGSTTLAGITTIGDAALDTVTINARLIDIPNVVAGTDNTVVVYNGSTLKTDEIDSKVWDGKLMDYTGTPVANQITTWSDVDTVGGSANLTFDGTTLILTGAIITSAAAQLLGNTTLGNAASDVVTLTGQLTGSAPVKFTNTLEVDGNVTLGNAGADTVTINATTVNIPNVAAGTDNTVVVYNGSTLLTDEIDSKVWGAKLIDYTGTPVANQLATWSDADTVGGSANLTYDGSTLILTGGLVTTAAAQFLGNTTLGNASSDVVTLTGQVTASSGLVVAGDALIVANGIPVQFLGNTTLGNTASDVTTLTGQMTASAGVLLSSTLTVAGNTTLGNASSDTVTSTAQLTASAGAVVSGDGLVVANGIPAQFLGNTTLGNTASDVITLTGQLTGSAPVKLTNTLEVDGNVTLGNASGDSVTINAATVNIPNVAAGTDNTVVVYNGSTLLTDEIDSRVWGSTLIDASGTPVANQIATWTDANTAQGASTLTYDGTTLYVAAAVVSGAQAHLSYASGDLVLSGAISGSKGRFNVETGNIIFSGSISGDGSGLTNTGLITSYATSGDNRILTSVDSTSIQGEAGLTFDGTTLILTGALESTGPVVIGGGLTAGNAASDVVTVAGQLTASAGVLLTSTVTVAGDIDHAGDPDTYLRFQTNTVNLVAGGKSAIKLDTSTAKIQLNNSNEDLDVQIMADDGAVILHTDATLKKVGIGTDAPSDTLTVVGTISGSSTLEAAGATTLGSTLNVSGTSTFSGVSTHEAHPIFETGITIKNADASAGYINFYEQSSNGTNVCTFRGKSSMGNCTITLPGDTGTVVLEDNTVTLSNKTIASPTITGATTAGNVGIGAAPTLPLDVQSTSAAMARLANTSNDAYGALLRLQNTRADSNAGVADDFCGGILFKAQDSTAAATQYGKISTTISSPTNTSEAGSMLFEVTTAGTTATPYLTLDGGGAAITASVDVHVQGATISSGSVYRMSRALKSTDYTLAAGDDIILMNTAAGVLTASLPSAPTVDGIVFTIKNSGANDMVIATTGGETIDGVGSLTGSLGKAWTLYADNDIWLILSSHQG